MQSISTILRVVVLYAVVLQSYGRAEEPAIEALLADSPLIVVATPVFESGRPPIGRGSEVVLVKYSMKFRVITVLKSDGSVKAEDSIQTRLALHIEKPDEETFKPDPNKRMILFLRKTSYEKDSFENTSIWFGVMIHTTNRQMMLEHALRNPQTPRPIKGEQD
jgi:hypothetical protein